MLPTCKCRAACWQCCGSTSSLRPRPARASGIQESAGDHMLDWVLYMASPVSGFKRFLFWDYPRAGWQYDVMVGLILAFIFLTPRAWFRDQPKASSIVMIRPDAFWMDSEQLSAVPDAERSERASTL